MKKMIALFMLIISSFLFQVDVNANESKKGIYEIQHISNDELIQLNGEWEFYWKKLYTPEDFNKSTTLSNLTYVSVPNGTNGFKLENGQVISNGYGTYRIHIKFPKEEIGTMKALYLPSIASAYNLWIDGKLLESNGVVGTNKASMEPQYLKKIVIFPINSDTVELVIQASNFNQRKAGIYSSIYLGNKNSITELREKNLIFRSLMVASFAIIGLYHLVLFLFHRKAKYLLFFSCSIFFIALRTMLLEDPIAFYILPFLSWNIASKLEYISFILGILFFAYYVFYQYPKEVSKKMRYLITAICLLYCAFVLFSSVYTSTKELVLLETIGFITVSYLLFINMFALKRKRDGSALNAIGTIILIIAGINDALFYNGYIQTFELASVALVFFIFTQSIIISRNYSKSFEKNEKYAKDLAILNASLEEKVQARTNELNETNKQLLAVNKKLTDVYESHKKLIDNISHEIRTPLTIIQTYTKGMIDGVLEQNNDYLNLVYQKGIHLSKILDDLVSLSDLENNGSKFDFEEVNVKRYFKELYEKLKLVLDKQKVNFEFVDNLSEDTVFFHIDQLRIEQVIVNLINNAKRYIDDDGTIQLKIEKQNDHHVKIGVCDNGIGIKESDIQHIFERFYSRDAPNTNYRGAGLGLAISKEIVERHKGKIWVEGVYGEGANFFISLPIVTN